MREIGRRLTVAELRDLLVSTGVTINDGDDEDDNVTNTGLDFKRVDVVELGKAILALNTKITVDFTLSPLTNSNSLKRYSTNIIVGDYNGDGRDDFIRQEKGWWDNDNVNTAHIFFSDGDGTFTVQSLTNSNSLKGVFNQHHCGRLQRGWKG